MKINEVINSVVRLRNKIILGAYDFHTRNTILGFPVFRVVSIDGESKHPPFLVLSGDNK